MIAFNEKLINHRFEGQVKIPRKKTHIKNPKRSWESKKSSIVQSIEKKYFKNFPSLRSISMNIKSFCLLFSIGQHYICFSLHLAPIGNQIKMKKSLHNRRAYCSHVKLIKLNNELWWAIFHVTSIYHRGEWKLRQLNKFLLSRVICKRWENIETIIIICLGSDSNIQWNYTF